jgi:hypothetical protein
VPGGKFIQIEVRLGDATVMLADEFPQPGALSPLTLGGTYGALDIATGGRGLPASSATAPSDRRYGPRRG